MKRAIEHDAYDGVECVGRKFLGTCHEIPSGIVDDGVDAAKLGVGFVGGSLDRGKIAHVAHGVSRGASGTANFFAGFVERIFAAADQEQLCAQRRETERHRAAQTCAAATEKDCPVFQKVALEHDSPSCAATLQASAGCIIGQSPHSDGACK